MKYVNKTITGENESNAAAEQASQDAASSSQAAKQVGDTVAHESEKAIASSRDLAEHLHVKPDHAAASKAARPAQERHEKASDFPAFDRDGSPNRAMQNATEQAEEIRESFASLLTQSWKIAHLTTTWWTTQLHNLAMQWSPRSSKR